MWAYLAYASFFVGLPVWIIPLAQRENPFALYHAKQAGASYILGFAVAMVVGVIAVVTCGFGAVLLPLAFFPVITSIHGLILVNNGEVREPMLVFGVGDKLFGSVQPKPPGSNQPQAQQAPPGWGAPQQHPPGQPPQQHPQGQPQQGVQGWGAPQQHPQGQPPQGPQNQPAQAPQGQPPQNQPPQGWTPDGQG